MELNVSDRENRIYKGPEAGERRWGRGSGQSKFSITRALSEDGVRGNDNEKKKMVEVQLGWYPEDKWVCSGLHDFLCGVCAYPLEIRGFTGGI